MPLEPAIAPNLAPGLVSRRPRVLKRTLSSQLARLAAGFAERPVRLGELIDVLQLRGYDAVLILLTFPFITPVPLPGFSIVFGTVIWLPSVFLGLVAADQFPGLKPGESDDVILRLLTANTGVVVAGFLGAAIMACVMATDSQILALGTMFTKDIVSYYAGARRFSEATVVWTGRAFVVAITAVAYFIALALEDKAGIFELAIRFAFSGFAALAPIMLAALFWRRSTKWGALAAALWVAGTMAGSWYLYEMSAGLALKPGQPLVPIFPLLGDLFLRSPGNVLVYGYLPVMPMVLGSAFLMVVVSLLTKPPSRTTLETYFPAPGDFQTARQTKQTPTTSIARKAG